MDSEPGTSAGRFLVYQSSKPGDLARLKLQNVKTEARRIASFPDHLTLICLREDPEILNMNTLAVARELAAMAQTGGHFAKDKYDQERYRRLGELAAELMAAGSDVHSETIHAWSKAEFGYATPKVDVRAFILQEDQVLLIREDADAGRWTLPGGWADVNESPSESVVREVEEESGYRVRPTRLLAVLDREKQGHAPPFPYHVYKMFFQCEITGGAPRSTAESSESAFFRHDNLPELSLSRVLPGQIQQFFAVIRSGALRTQFD